LFGDDSVVCSLAYVGRYELQFALTTVLQPINRIFELAQNLGLINMPQEKVECRIHYPHCSSVLIIIKDGWNNSFFTL
jgi:hypothetical protein